MSAKDHPLFRTADDVIGNPEQYDVTQRHWAQAFRAAEDSQSIHDEVAFLEASYPSRFPHPDWYSFFLNRCDSTLLRCDLNELSSFQLLTLAQLRSRFAAFSGQLRGSRLGEFASSNGQQKANLTVGVDIRPLSIPSSRKRGIGRYLLNTLSRLVARDDKHRFVLLSDGAIDLDAELRTSLDSGRTEYRSFGPECDRDLDVFLLTDPLPMLTGRRLADLPIRDCPWLSIIYDFIPLEFPDLYLRDSRQLTDEYLENFAFVAQRCECLFPISLYVGKQCETLLQMPPERVIPIYGGVGEAFFEPREVVDHSAEPYFLYVGGADARKNIPGLLKSFELALPQLPRQCKLILVGEMTKDKTAQMLEAMNMAHLSDKIIGMGSVSDEQLISLYGHALATVFVSYCEGLGLPALEAMACGCPVLASKTTALGETVGECGVLVDPSSPSEIARGFVTLASDPSLRARLCLEGPAYARKWQWDDVAELLGNGIETYARRRATRTTHSRRLRVAMMNRADVWSAPGGDSRIMQQMQAAVKSREIEVSFPTTAEEVASSDIVHFINMTLPAPLFNAAQLASKYSKPFVVTTLYEDWPLYLNASHQAFSVFAAHLMGKLKFSDLVVLLKEIQVPQAAPRLDVSLALASSQALLACGKSEAVRIESDFPEVAGRVQVLPFAVTAPLAAEQKTVDALKNALGFSEFVLCIGRLETRKNQLALLAALQDEDIPIVFAAGSFSPQKSYDQAVRSWKRKAPVKFVDRVPWYLMSALIRSASVHALPSFYELPGLVHLECAAAGVPIVASTWGALSDYIPTTMFNECDPLDLQSIRAAVVAALSHRPAPAAVDMASSYTAELLADNLGDLYVTIADTGSQPRNKYLYSHHRRKSPQVTGGIHVAV